MDNNRRTIAIAGAGIAGLTAALALQKAGFSVTIFEKSPVPATTGTGIQLSPNSLKVLFDLGLRDTLAKIGFAPDSIEIGDGLTGKSLTSFALGDEIRQRHAAPYLVLHRSDLANILETACLNKPKIAICRGHPVQHVSVTNASADVTVNGEQTIFDAVIGADGTWSTLRKYVPYASPPQFTGRVAWRATLNACDVPGTLPQNKTGLWLGPNAHLVHYPLCNRQQFNVIAITPWDEARPPKRGWLDNPETKSRTAAFSNWHAPLRDLSNLDGNWGGWPIYSISNAAACADKNLCLIGDAAHTMVPYGAQGGSAAIEDAAILALCCAQNPQDMTKAFTRFESIRMLRIQNILNLSNNNRRIYHMERPLSLARNLAMRIAPQEAMQKRMDWLYGWEANELS